MKIGYMLTEFGKIPTDWMICQIPFLLLKRGGIKIGPFGSQLKKELLVKEGFKVYGQENIYEKDFEIGIRFINSEHFVRLKSCEIKSGDFIISMMGTIGKTMIVPENIQKGIMDSHLLRLRFNESLIFPTLLQHYFSSSLILDQISKLSVGGIMDGLSSKIISNISICIPTDKNEQIAITSALNDIDSLIDRLEKLIKKKRAIMQGTMQQLLKPKENWELITLKKVCWFQEGPGVRNYQFTNNGVKLLNGTNIESGKLMLDKTIRYISVEEAYGAYSHFLVESGDIIIACSGVSIDRFDEKVTYVEEQHLPLCMNTSTMRFKIISKKLHKDYFFHFLKSDSFKEQIGGRATGSAQLNFGPSHVEKVQISLPSIPDQIEISSILTTMNSEIEAFEQKLLKYQMIKQGMMQNLLTGKIRLI